MPVRSEAQPMWLTTRPQEATSVTIGWVTAQAGQRILLGKSWQSWLSGRDPAWLLRQERTTGG